MNRDDQLSYCMDGTGRIIELKSLKVRPEQSIIDNFKKYCASDNVTRAFCQVDRDSHEQVKEGMTTFGVQTKDSRLITIAVHENNYEACKDQMAVLNSAICKANEKISSRRKDIGRTIAIAGVTIVLLGSFTWAAKIKLEEYGIIGSGKKVKVEKETTEATTEKLEDFATPVDATTEESSLEDKYSADQIRESMEKTNEEQIQKQLDGLTERREDLGLSTDAVGTPERSYVEPVSERTDNEINLSADEIRTITERVDQEQAEKQKQYVNDLRQSYLEEYKRR